MTGDPLFGLAGRAALLTGCGSAEGVGFASARLLARLGARVAITPTTDDRVLGRAGELGAVGATVFARAADLTDREQTFALVAAAQAEVGPFDLLANAAGMAQSGIDPVTGESIAIDGGNTVQEPHGIDLYGLD